MAKQNLNTSTKTQNSRSAKNNNLGSFVDVVTPEPKIILEDFLDIESLGAYLKTANTEQKEYINQLIDIILSITKQEEFLSLGEKIALNTLRKMNILV